MMRAFKSLFALGFAALLALGIRTGGDAGAAEDGPQISPADAARDALSIDRVKEHVAKLAALGTRVPGTKGNQDARDYIVETLASFGYRNGTDVRHVASDLLETSELAAQAGADGQVFEKLLPPSAVLAPFNVRLTIGDKDNSITEGVAVVAGTGMDGQPLTEEIKLKASINGAGAATGDKPFKAVRSITLKNVRALTAGDTVSAACDTRFQIGAQRFWGTAPLDDGSGTLKFTDAEGAQQSLPIYAAWPNGAAVSTTGAGGLSGPLVYAGSGQPGEFDGLPVEGALVLLEFPEGQQKSADVRWTQAASFGARAVIFIEPQHALRPNMENIFVETPVEFPRFWMPREQGEALKKTLLQAAAKKAWPTAKARAVTSWKRDIWENIFLLVPGSGAVTGAVRDAEKAKARVDALTPGQEAGKSAQAKASQLLGQPKAPYRELLDALLALEASLKAENADASALKATIDDLRTELASTVVVSAYYDSNSAVPALAPGAEQALSCAALLELARQYQTTPPPRDTLLLFCNGHFQALKGEREFFSEVEALPESCTDGNLSRTLGCSFVYAGKDRTLIDSGATYDGILQQINAGEPSGILDRLTRSSLEGYAAHSAKGYTEDAESETFETKMREEIAKKGGVSQNGILVGVAFLLLAIALIRTREIMPLLGAALFILGAIVVKDLVAMPQFTFKAVFVELLKIGLIVGVGATISSLRKNYTIRVLIGSTGLLTSIVAVLFWAVIPYLQQAFPGSDKISDANARLDELVNMMKEEAATQESELERQLRVLRAESTAVNVYEQVRKNRAARELEAILKDPASAGVLDEFDRIEKNRKEYEEIGRFLYTRTSQGLSLAPPANPERLSQKLDKVVKLTLKRLKSEQDWAWREFTRREDNRCLREIAESRLAREAEKATGRKTLFLSLDLSAGHEGVGLFYKGAFYNQPGDIESKYKGYWGRMVMPIARGVEKALGVPNDEAGALMPDTLLENKGRRWDTYLGTPLAVASEIAVQAQVRGLTLATPYDRRLAWDSPQDTLSRLERPREAGEKYGPWDRVASQLKVIGPFVRNFMAEASVTQESRFNEKLRFTSYSQVIFKAVRRGGSRSIFPNIPVTDTMVQACVDPGSASSVRLGIYDCTNPLGMARLAGLRRDARWNFEISQCDRESGEITFVTDKPKHQLDENRSFSVHIGAKTRTEQVELFQAQGVAILDVVDPRYFVPLMRCKILAGQTESQPQAFGSSNVYNSEPCRVLYAEPGTRIKCLFREGQFGVRLTVLDVKPDIFEKLRDKNQAPTVSASDARGPGFQLGSRKVLPWMPRRTAIDLWCLGEQRLGELRAHSIGNAKLDNPAYPGEYSDGKAKVVQGSDVVERPEPGEARAWTDQCMRLRFRVLGEGETYGVKAIEGPHKLVLDRPYKGDSAAGKAFELTREEPGLHNIAKLRLAEALAAEKAGNLGTAWQRYTEAWGLESRAYPEVLGTAHDSVMGVVFYLFLLLPFCFFIERLVFASKTIERQIMLFFAIFIGMFCLLWGVHPAFSLVAAPPIILLAFVIMSLAGIVIAIVYGKFNTEMRMMQQGVQGVQSADVNRASAGLVAVTLGISQMRRRLLRTMLTCLTVVLLTFTALSFTSMVPSLAQAHIDLSPGTEKDAPYQGIMIRQLNWDTLRIDAYEQFERELNQDGLQVCPSFWRVAKADQKIFVDVINEDGKIASPSSMMGLSPYHKDLYGSKVGESLVAGRWLDAGDRSVVLLPESIARILYQPKDAKDADWDVKQVVGRNVKLGSYEVNVIGIFKPDLFSNEIKDLDGEPITPVDFSASQASRGAEAKNDQDASVESLGAVASTKYQHVNAGESIIVPWQLASVMGGDLRAVAVKIDDKEKLEYVKDRILKRVQKNLFVGMEGRRRLYASTPKTNLTGLGNLLVPLAISVLILLNVMIGAVYERNREIKIFSALGLAPSHIAALFLAEAIVYATLGAILGYLLGQGAAKFVQVFGEQLGIGGLYLNYSSSSAVFVTGLVMASVVASTLYPAWQASRAAAPSEDRSWGVPDPVGDEISLELPFSFQRDLVPGAALFLHEYFDSHAESSLGKFTAKEVTLEAFHTDNGQGMCLFFIAWLSPYDLGVSQEVQIYIVPTAEGLYVTEASFFRISGYVTSWQRVNLPFLNALRKHLLIWRTFSPQQRLDYAIRGYYQFQEAFEAVGWPPPEGMDLPPREELDGEPEAEEDVPPQTLPSTT
ncbi:MAG: FtsX-like permease family protein [Planctomycetota bacterium]|nr:FtsX-like permease family protein [Planctomycetota bacterium]